MCFCAGASFTATAALSIAGAAAIYNIKSKHQIPFALMPLLFAIQQFSEGIIWLSAKNNNLTLWQKPAIYIFLIFAFIIWPVYTPFSVMLLEPNKKRKTIIKYFMFFGIFISFFLSISLFIFGAQASLDNHHINYNLWVPLIDLSIPLYCIPTILPLFISSIKKIWLFGLALAISCLISFIVWREFFISIWCFFAAILSILIVLILQQKKQ